MTAYLKLGRAADALQTEQRCNCTCLWLLGMRTQLPPPQLQTAAGAAASPVAPRVPGAVIWEFICAGGSKEGLQRCRQQRSLTQRRPSQGDSVCCPSLACPPFHPIPGHPTCRRWSLSQPAAAAQHRRACHWRAQHPRQSGSKGDTLHSISACPSLIPFPPRLAMSNSCT